MLGLFNFCLRCARLMGRCPPRLRRIGLVLVDLELADDAIKRRPFLVLRDGRQIGALGDGAGVALRKPPIGPVGRVAEDNRRRVRFQAGSNSPICCSV